jgi:hypothetical protein
MTSHWDDPQRLPCRFDQWTSRGRAEVSFRQVSLTFQTSSVRADSPIELESVSGVVDSMPVRHDVSRTLQEDNGRVREGTGSEPKEYDVIMPVHHAFTVCVCGTQTYQDLSRLRTEIGKTIYLESDTFASSQAGAGNLA